MGHHRLAAGLSIGAGRREYSQQHIQKFTAKMKVTFYVLEARCDPVLRPDPPLNPSPFVKLEHVMQTGIHFLLN